MGRREAADLRADRHRARDGGGRLLERMVRPLLLEPIARARFAGRDLAEGTLESAARSTLAARGEELLGGEGGDFLGKGEGDELVERDTLLLSKLACRLVK
jgi:hypothetical protein